MDYSLESVSQALDSLFSDIDTENSKLFQGTSTLNTQQAGALGTLTSDVENLRSDLVHLKSQIDVQGKGFMSSLGFTNSVDPQIQAGINRIGEELKTKIAEFNSLGVTQHTQYSPDALQFSTPAAGLLDQLGTIAKWAAIGLAVGAAIYVAINIKRVLPA